MELSTGVQDSMNQNIEGMEVETTFDHEGIRNHMMNIRDEEEFGGGSGIDEQFAKRNVMLYVGSQTGKDPANLDYDTSVKSYFDENTASKRPQDLLRVIKNGLRPNEDESFKKLQEFKAKSFDEQWEEVAKTKGFGKEDTYTPYGTVPSGRKSDDISTIEKQAEIEKHKSSLFNSSRFAVMGYAQKVMSDRAKKYAFDMSLGNPTSYNTFLTLSRDEQAIFFPYVRALNPAVDGNNFTKMWGRLTQTFEDRTSGIGRTIDNTKSIFESDVNLYQQTKNMDFMKTYQDGLWTNREDMATAQKFFDDMLVRESAIQGGYGFGADEIDVTSEEFQQRMKEGARQAQEFAINREIKNATRKMYESEGFFEDVLVEGTAMGVDLAFTLALSAKTGGLGGLAYTGSTFYGDMVDTLVYDHGVDFNDASAISAVATLPYALVEVSQAKMLGGSMKQAEKAIAEKMIQGFPKFLKESDVAKKAITNLSEAGVNYTGEVSQEVFQNSIDVIAKAYAKEFADAEGIEYDDLMKEWWESNVMAMKALILPSAGSKAMQMASSGIKGGSFANLEEANNITDEQRDAIYDARGSITGQDRATIDDLGVDFRSRFEEAETTADQKEVIKEMVQDGAISADITPQKVTEYFELKDELDSLTNAQRQSAFQALDDVDFSQDFDTEASIKEIANLQSYKNAIGDYGTLERTDTQDLYKVKGEGGAQINVQVVDSMEGSNENASYNSETNTIVLPRNAQDFTFNHELVHGMVANGLISEADYKKLAKDAMKFAEQGLTEFKDVEQIKETYNKKRAEKGLEPIADADLEEEAVAMMIESFRRNGAPVEYRNTFNRIMDFFRDLLAKTGIISQSAMGVARDVFEGKPLGNKPKVIEQDSSQSLDSTTDTKKDEPIVFQDSNGKQYTKSQMKEVNKQVADDWRQLAKDIRKEDKYASHVTEETKDETLNNRLKEADRIERGDYDNMELWIVQRVNEKLTGENVGILGNGSTSDTKFSLEYRMTHTAPTIEEGNATGDDLTPIFGDDIYTGNALSYFGTGQDSMDRESLNVINRMYDNPNEKVTIYRAMPTDKGAVINDGDWVTTSKTYAEQHAMYDKENGIDVQIVEADVYPRQLATDGNSIHEWGVWELDQGKIEARNEPSALDLDLDEAWEEVMEENELDDGERDFWEFEIKERALENAGIDPSEYYDEHGDNFKYSLAPPTDSEAFKEWFGDSKVVNEDGSPKVVYHGTDNGAFNSFMEDETEGMFKRSFFHMFTDDKSYADSIGKRTIDAYLRIENPLKSNQSGYSISMDTEIKEQAIKDGFDGIISSEGYYIAFYPNQIKSATDNVGTFDPSNPDIRYSLAPENADVHARSFIAQQMIQNPNLEIEDLDYVFTALEINEEDRQKIIDDASAIVKGMDDEIKKATNRNVLKSAIRDESKKLALQDRIRGIQSEAMEGGALMERAKQNIRERRKRQRELSTKGLNDEELATLTENLRQSLISEDGVDKALKDIEESVRKKMVKEGAFTDRKKQYKKDPVFKIAYGKTLKTVALNLARDLAPSRRKDALYRDARKLDKYATSKAIDNNFSKFMDRLNESRKVEDKKTLLKRFNKLMNSSAVKERDKTKQELIRSKFVKDENGNIVAKSLHPQDRRRIKLIKQVADLSKKKTDAMIKTLINLIEENKFDSDKAQKSMDSIQEDLSSSKAYNHFEGLDKAEVLLEALKNFGSLKNKSASEIADAMDIIQRDIDESFSRIEDIINKKNARVDPMRDALADTKGQRSGKARRGFGRALSYAFDMRSWFDTIANKAPSDKEAEARKVLDGLLREWNHAIQNRDLAIDSTHLEYNRNLELIYGKPAWQVMNDLEELKKEYSHLSATGDPMSKGQVMQLYASGVQEDYQQQAMDRGGLMQYLEVLTDQDLKLIEWYREYYADQRSALSAKLEEMTGIPIDMQDPYYVPVSIKMPQGDMPTEIVTTNIIPDGMIQRVKHKHDFDDTASINQMWIKKVSENEHFLNTADVAVDMRSVFSSPRVQEAIEHNFGGGFKSGLLGMIQDNINDGYAGEKKIESLDKLRGAWTASKFAFNVRIGLKQITSIPAFGFEIGLVQTAKYLSEVATPQGIEAMKEIASSDLIKNRIGRGNTEEVMNALSSPLLRTNKVNLSKFTKRMMFANIGGDLFPSLVIGQGIYRSQTEKYYGQGMPMAEAKATALKDLFQIIESTQQSSKMKDWSEFQRRYGSLGRMMSQFTNTTRQFLVRDFTDIGGYISKAIDTGDWRNDKLGKAGETLFINHVLLPAFYNGMNMLINVMLGDDIEEDDWWLMLASMFAGPMSGFIVFGSIITGTSQEMITGKPSYGGSSLTPFAGVADDFKALGMMTRGILTADMEEFTKQLDKLLSSLVAPYREGKKYMKNN